MEHWQSTSIPLAHDAGRHRPNPHPRALTLTSGNGSGGRSSGHAGALDSKSGVRGDLGIENQDPRHQVHEPYYMHRNHHTRHSQLLFDTPGHHEQKSTLYSDQNDDDKFFKHKPSSRSHLNQHSHQQATVFELSPQLTHQYHAPLPPISTLPSNDTSRDRLQRLQARHRRRHHQHHRRADISTVTRPYLRDPKYLTYRARQRCDTGADGKPVWDNAMEDAFQNALVHIPPMGRKKKVQKTKTYGRNELISEWILQETGQHRSRKQVSSHIQVLNGLLKGIPEWDVLIVAEEDEANPSNTIAATSRGHPPMAFYENSIQHEVQRLGYGSRYQHSQSFSSICKASSNPQLTSLDFEMWVSSPQQMDKAIHIYTRLQSPHSPPGTMPLEDLCDWRTLYPDLAPVITSWESQTLAPERCDVIQLSATFQLMGDFPPPASKLGISLELDFINPSDAAGSTAALAAYTDWNCATHMYHEQGKLLKEVTFSPCHVSRVGKVKPFFESKWWAAQFTELTETKRRAEDAGDLRGVEAAEKAAGQFLEGLTVSQQIFARGSSRGSSKRMAVLLWRFGRARAPYVGTTNWVRLVPAPARATTCSPLVGHGEVLGGLDGIVADGVGDGFDAGGHDFLAQHGHGTGFGDLFLGVGADELCQDRFMADDMSNFAALHGAFDGVGHGEGLEGFSFDLHPDDMQEMQHHQHGGEGELLHHQQPQITNGNLFESNHVDGLVLEMDPGELHHSHSHRLQLRQHNQQQQQQRKPQHDSDDDETRQPLANFDVSTSKMLQEQVHRQIQDAQMQEVVQAQQQEQRESYMKLQLDEGHGGNSDLMMQQQQQQAHRAHEETQGSNGTVLASDMHQHLNLDTDNGIRLSTNHTPSWVAPVPTRPMFHSHAGYLAEQALDVEDSEDITTQHHYQPSSAAEDEHAYALANLAALDANQLAAVLTAHNVAADHAAAAVAGYGGNDGGGALRGSFEHLGNEGFGGTEKDGLRAGFAEVEVDVKVDIHKGK